MDPRSGVNRLQSRPRTRRSASAGRRRFRLESAAASRTVGHRATQINLSLCTTVAMVLALTTGPSPLAAVAAWGLPFVAVDPQPSQTLTVAAAAADAPPPLKLLPHAGAPYEIRLSRKAGMRCVKRQEQGEAGKTGRERRILKAHLTTDARASGLTPVSISPIRIASVSLSRPVSRIFDIWKATGEEEMGGQDDVRKKRGLGQTSNSQIT